MLSRDPWTVMGILNVTPDSFHDGGRYLNYVLAVTRAREMAAAGAGIIDVGGESTRPGAQPVAAEEELKRVIPVIEALAAHPGIPVSIDTSKAAVARAALKAGASMINDVTALRGDSGMAAVAAEASCPICLMHMLGEPRTMQDDPQYGDVIADITAFFLERIDFAVSQGIKRENIIIDPGIGFGKTLVHNLEILRRLDDFGSIGLPLLIGVSRKRFIGMIMGDEGTSERLPGTIAANLMAFEKGARIFRVHDVAENHQALMVVEALSVSGRGQ
ncbi:MAG: dihydropteroate synthase [Thermoleophilia bacterium]|nr:dihydropteroate synthase [Thermoleophilia bacterium]